MLRTAVRIKTFQNLCYLVALVPLSILSGTLLPAICELAPVSNSSPLAEVEIEEAVVLREIPSHTRRGFVFAGAPQRQKILKPPTPVVVYLGHRLSDGSIAPLTI